MILLFLFYALFVIFIFALLGLLLLFCFFLFEALSFFLVLHFDLFAGFGLLLLFLVHVFFTHFASMGLRFVMHLDLLTFHGFVPLHFGAAENFPFEARFLFLAPWLIVFTAPASWWCIEAFAGFLDCLELVVGSVDESLEFSAEPFEVLMLLGSRAFFMAFEGELMNLNGDFAGDLFALDQATEEHFQAGFWGEVIAIVFLIVLSSFAGCEVPFDLSIFGVGLIAGHLAACDGTFDPFIDLVPIDGALGVGVVALLFAVLGMGRRTEESQRC